MTQQIITAWQAQFYADHGLSPPVGSVVAPSVATEFGPVAINNRPTYDAQTFIEDFGGGQIGSGIFEQIVANSAPISNQFGAVRALDTVLYNIDEFSVITPVIPASLPDVPDKPGVPTPEVVPEPPPKVIDQILDNHQEGGTFQVITELAGQIADPLGFFDISGGNPTLNSRTASIGGFAGGAAMVLSGGGLALSRLAVVFTGIGRAVQQTNNKIPLGKGMLSRLGQITGILWAADTLGLGNPFNNQSTQDQIEDMITDALEGGAIDDNRAYNRSTGELAPLQAIVILYDRMGQAVERMYAVSFRPANPRSVARRTTRNSNVVRRRKTPRRRNS